MTTEDKALALVNEISGPLGCYNWNDATRVDLIKALTQTIEAHEAFAQRVSDAVELRMGNKRHEYGCLAEFVIAKADPLVEAVTDLYGVFNEGSGPVDATDHFRAALASRGLEIRKVGE